MYFTLEAHNARLKELVELKPNALTVVSYGLYAGVLDDGRDAHAWGKKFASNTHLFLDSLKDIPTTITVGLPPPSNCSKKASIVPCPHCQQNYLKGLRRMWHHQKAWSNITWKVCVESHMKAYVFSYPRKTVAIVGGRNLTDSNWHDFTMEVVGEKAEQIRDHCNEFSSNCLPMNGETLKKIAVEFGLPLQQAATC